MNIWRTSRLYRVVVVGGLIVCVAVPVYLGLGPYKDDPGNKTPGYAAIAAVGVYIFLIFAMQIASLRRAPDEEIGFEEPPQRPLGPADPPLGWQALSAEMAIADADPTGRQLAGGNLKGGMVRQLVLGAGLMVCAIGGMIAFLSGAPAYVFAPALLFVILLVATVPGMMGAARAGGNAYLRPLGLSVIAMPRSTARMQLASGTMQHHVEGPTSFAGERHGRMVRIDLEGRSFKTRVNGKFKKLDVAGEGGKLTASDESPPELRALIESLSADDRWRNVTARSRGDGVTVTRKKTKLEDSLQAHWLDDLWLAEAIADRSAK